MTHGARSILTLVALLTWGPVAFFASVCTAADPAAAVAPVTTAATTGPQIVSVQAGFAGKFKLGSWAPFEIELRGGAEATRGTVEMVLLDGDAVPSRVTAPADGLLDLRAGETLRVPLVAKLGQLHGQIVVTFRGEMGPLATRSFETAVSGPFAGILPVGRELFVRCGRPTASAGDSPRRDPNGPNIVDVARLAELPTNWLGYEGVDAVLLVTGDETQNEALLADSPQLQALALWVRMGGRLVLSVGRDAPRLLVADSALARLAPGKFEAMVRLPQTAPLEAYADGSEPIDIAAARAWQSPKLVDVRGRIEAYFGSRARDLPLVIRTSHGFGEIVLLAADLDLPPLSDWSGRGQLLDKLLRRSRRPVTESEDGTLGQVTTLGFSDLSGQLRGALDQFEDVPLVPFWFVALLILAYILCIGPLDYYVVRRVLRRPEATWVTFTLTVVAFSVGAYVLAERLKGTELRMNQVDLVDFDAEGGLVRGTSWQTIYSPDSAMYDLSLTPPPTTAGSQPPATALSWSGLPGSGFGGMRPAAGSLPLFTTAYDFSRQLDRMIGVPIAVWSTKAFVGRWWADAPGPIEADLSDHGKLVGTVTSHLDAPLDDCLLIYENWAYPLRQFKPGDRVNVDAQIDPQTIETYLRRVRVQGDRDVAPPYDRASFDIPRIIEIMSCHELAGGESYTFLAGAYQPFVDLSGAVRNGRAVLIGRQAHGATELVNGKQSLAAAPGQRWTFYRFVFPVSESHQK